MAGTKKIPDLVYTSYKDTEEGQAKNKALSDALENYNSYWDHNWANEVVYQQWLKKINRDPFSYALDADALYRQYKDKYIQQGKLAMEDTIGQASALTGGYANSYATGAGYQAYQAHLENLNDVIPELYNMALNKYNMEGQEIAKNLALLDADYNKSLSDWQIGYGQRKDKLDVANSDFYNSADLYGSEQEISSRILDPGGDVIPTESEATNSFIATHKTKDEYMDGGMNYKQFKEYIEAEIEKVEDNFSDEELTYLIQYYGLS